MLSGYEGASRLGSRLSFTGEHSKASSALHPAELWVLQTLLVSFENNREVGIFCGCWTNSIEECYVSFNHLAEQKEAINRTSFC